MLLKLIFFIFIQRIIARNFNSEIFTVQTGSYYLRDLYNNQIILFGFVS